MSWHIVDASIVVNLDNSQITEHQIRCIEITSIDSTCVISSPNPIFDHLLESSHRDDSNKWSNIRFGEEKGILEIKIHTISGPWNLKQFN